MCVWALHRRACVALARLLKAATCAAFHPDGGAVAVGLVENELCVLQLDLDEGQPADNGYSLVPVLRRAVGGGPRGEHDERERALQNRPEISADGGKGGAGGAGGAPASDKLDRYTTCIKFSPTGQMLALGSADRHIYLFNVESNSSSGYKRVATLRGHVATRL